MQLYEEFQILGTFMICRYHDYDNILAIPLYQMESYVYKTFIEENDSK